MNDLRYAVRSLRKQRGFVAAAVITLGLGIGATTAIFSVVNGVLLRPLRYPESHRVVRIWANNPDRNLPFFSVSPADYLDWREQAHGFEVLGAFTRQSGAVLTGLGDPSVELVSRVTPEVFQVLRTVPALGRRLAAEDITEGRRVIVVGQGFWRQYLGADPGALGRTLEIDGAPYTLVGVMPPGFSVPGTPAALWTPLDLRTHLERDSRFLRVIGRLAPGASVGAATSELATISARLARQYPASNQGWTVTVRSLRDMIVGDQVQLALLILLGVVGLVLLIACANVANLLLVRASGRTREFAIRAALGASRTRMFRASLAESLVLTGMAGVLGVALAMWGVDVLKTLRPEGLPRLDAIAVNGTVLAFTMGLSLTTGLLFGLAPGARIPMANLQATLRSDTRMSTRRGAARARAGLVVTQIALALVLTAAAALLVSSLARLQRVELGFDPKDLITFQLHLAADRYPTPQSALAFFDRLEERVGALPGVAGVGLVSVVPHGGPYTGGLFVPEGREVSPSEAPAAEFIDASAQYFQTMGIPLVAGQPLPGRGEEAHGVVAINRTMARQFWPGQSAVGRRIRLGNVVSGPLATIVGVVGDARYHSLDDPVVGPTIYFSHRDGTRQSLTLVVRGAGSRPALVRAVRESLASIDPGQPITAVRTMDDLLSAELSERRFDALLFGLFAGLALVLATVGIYAVLAYTVTQQAREIGIRVALGASRLRVVGRYLSQAAQLAVAGIVVGTGLALLLTRVLRALLYDTSPTDPVAFAVVVAGLLLIALVATYVPVRRAVRVDPVEVMRYE